MREVVIKIEKNGAIATKTMKTLRSNEGLLKKLKKQAEPTSRIMTLNGVLTLVCHSPLALITVA